MNQAINIAVVDDDVLFSTLLSEFLESQGLFNIVYTVQNGVECLEKLNDLTELPEIILLDLKMNQMNGIETAEMLKIHFPAIKIIVISSHYHKSFMGFMMKTGISAFIPKGVSPPKLIEILLEVNKKGYFFMDEQLEVLRQQVSSKAPSPCIESENVLSEREIEILQLICQQKTAKEIGDELFITQRTVEGHKNNLFIKTGVKNIAGLVIYAVQKELINASEIPLF